MKLQDLTKEEQLEIFGGSEASDSFWTVVGLTLRALWEFGEAGATAGGYAQCKCP